MAKIVSPIGPPRRLSERRKEAAAQARELLAKIRSDPEADQRRAMYDIAAEMNYEVSGVRKLLRHPEKSPDTRPHVENRWPRPYG